MAATGCIEPVYVQDVSSSMSEWLPYHLDRMTGFTPQDFPNQVLRRIGRMMAISIDTFRVQTRSYVDRPRPVYASTGQYPSPPFASSLVILPPPVPSSSSTLSSSSSYPPPPPPPPSSSSSSYPSSSFSSSGPFWGSFISSIYTTLSYTILISLLCTPSTALQIGLLPNINVPELVPYLLPRPHSAHSARSVIHPLILFNTPSRTHNTPSRNQTPSVSL